MVSLASSLFPFAVSGDGPNNSGARIDQVRDETVARRITINGLPIINDRFNISRAPMPNLDLYYRHCVIGGPGAFLVVSHGFKSFAQAIRRKLILAFAEGVVKVDGELACEANGLRVGLFTDENQG